MKKGWMGFSAAGALLALAVIGSHLSSKQPVAIEVAGPAPTWVYDVQKDDMRGTSFKSAVLTSSNEPELAFPYQGGSPITLNLGKKVGSNNAPGNTGVTLALAKGQFDCSTFDGSRNCLITVKVDQEPALDIRGLERDCGEQKCLDLVGNWNKPRSMTSLSIIQKAKVLIVEVPLYNFGNYQYKFQVGGLQWDKEKEIEG